jgi:autotransporter-associated beta strand protein
VVSSGVPFRSFFAALTGLALLVQVIQLAAADRFYDVDPATAAIDGGTANWSDSKWKSSSDATSGSAWAGNDTAIFNSIVGAPTTTSITLGGTETATAVTFNGAGYTVNSGTLSLAGTGGSNWITMNANGTIASALTHLRFKGSAEATISGGGALGGNRIVLGDGGGTTVTVRQTAGAITTSDYLMIGGNNVANSQGHYIMDGGSLQVSSGAYFGWGSASNSGTFTQNGGTVTIGNQGLQLGIGGGSGSYILNGGTLDSYFGNDSSSGSFTFGGGTLKAAAGFTANTQRVSSTTIASGATAKIDTSGHNITWSNELIGSQAAGLTKSGFGTLILNGNYTGDLRVERGLMQASSATSLGTGTITVTDVPMPTLAAHGGAIDLNGFNFTNNFYLGDRSSGPADIGVLHNSAAGTTSVLSGAIQIGGENYGGGAGNTVFQGVISGGKVTHYAFYKRDAGTWTLANEANTFDGFWYQIGGTTEVKKLANINQASSLGRATTSDMNQIRFGFNGGGGGRILYTGANASTSDRVIILQGNTAAENNRIEASGTVASASLTLTGSLSAGNGYTLALGGTNAGINTYAGTIGNGSNLALLKDGTTTWRLSGNSTYTGATTVQAGKLLVDGAIASTATVQSGASIGGSGRVGSLILDSGSTLTPGNSPGTLAVNGNTTWNGGANYNWQVYAPNTNPADQSAAGTGWDLLNVGGILMLSGLDSTPFNLNLWSLSGTGPDVNGQIPGWDPALGSTWLIASAAGGITLNGSGLLANTDYSGLFNINTAATNGTGGWIGSLPSSFQVVTLGNTNNLYLYAAPGSAAVPEPGQIAASLLLLAGIGGYVWLKRRKQKAAA